MDVKRIVIIDDHPIVRQGFKQLIEMETDLRVVGEADDAYKGIGVIKKIRPDLALVDLSLKEGSGLELIKNLQNEFPALPILVVSLHDENVYAERALKAGAKGFIMKAEATENVMIAIRQVLNGGIYLSNSMKTKFLERLTGPSARLADDMSQILSDREFEVFQLIGEGLKTRSIAEQLNLSIKTVETYKSHIKIKLQLKDSVELIQRAVEWSLRKQL